MARLMWSDLYGDRPQQYVVEGTFRIVVDGRDKREAMQTAERILSADGIQFRVIEVKEGESNGLGLRA